MELDRRTNEKEVKESRGVENNLKWQYIFSLFLLLLSQILFFGLTFYHTDSQGRSWIFFHQEHWIWVLVLDILALVVFVYGMFSEVTGSLGEEEWTE